VPPVTVLAGNAFVVVTADLRRGIQGVKRMIFPNSRFRGQWAFVAHASLGTVV
jgi:hypothetical protein